jgi:hypothetical protein
MSEIDENIIFKKDPGEKIAIPQEFVGLKAKKEGILTVNIRTPPEKMESITTFFNGLRGSEQITYDIGNTGEVECYFKGLAPLLQQTDDSGSEYSFLSVTLQELEDECEDPEISGCGCG